MLGKSLAPARALPTMARLMNALVPALFWLLGSNLACGAPADWPTLHRDLQRSGFSPSFPKGKLRLLWRKELWRELTGPRSEGIVGGGLAFMETYTGNLYAWDAVTGRERWAFKTGGPIGHSPMFHDGAVFTGSMDRKFCAIDSSTGKLRWTYEATEGIWVSP